MNNRFINNNIGRIKIGFGIFLCIFILISCIINLNYNYYNVVSAYGEDPPRPEYNKGEPEEPPYDYAGKGKEALSILTDWRDKNVEPGNGVLTALDRYPKGSPNYQQVPETEGRQALSTVKGGTTESAKIKDYISHCGGSPVEIDIVLKKSANSDTGGLDGRSNKTDTEGQQVKVKGELKVNADGSVSLVIKGGERGTGKLASNQEYVVKGYGLPNVGSDTPIDPQGQDHDMYLRTKTKYAKGTKDTSTTTIKKNTKYNVIKYYVDINTNKEIKASVKANSQYIGSYLVDAPAISKYKIVGYKEDDLSSKSGVVATNSSFYINLRKTTAYGKKQTCFFTKSNGKAQTKPKNYYGVVLLYKPQENPTVDYPTKPVQDTPTFSSFVAAQDIYAKLNNQYDVKESIPTSEILTYELKTTPYYITVDVEYEPVTVKVDNVRVLYKSSYSYQRVPGTNAYKTPVSDLEVGEPVEVTGYGSENKWFNTTIKNIKVYKLTYGKVEADKTIDGKQYRLYQEFDKIADPNVSTIHLNKYKVKCDISPFAPGKDPQVKRVSLGHIALGGEPATQEVARRVNSFFAKDYSTGGYSSSYDYRIDLAKTIDNYTYIVNDQGTKITGDTAVLSLYGMTLYVNKYGRISAKYAGLNGALSTDKNNLLKSSDSSSASKRFAIKYTKEEVIPSYYPNGTYPMIDGIIKYELVTEWSRPAGNGHVTPTRKNYNTADTVRQEVTNSITKEKHNVIIHTPIIDYSSVSTVDFTESQLYNSIEEKNSKYYLMLDQSFTINIPKNIKDSNGKFVITNKTENTKFFGKNTSKNGYSNTRDYNNAQGEPKEAITWAKVEDVKFPFDVYVHEQKTNNKPVEEHPTKGESIEINKYFLPANTWLSTLTGVKTEGTTKNVSANENLDTEYTFTIPVWVKENTYTIQTKIYAENAYGEDGKLIDHRTAQSETLANVTKFNGDEWNYVVTNDIPVKVIGKIYDLRINATNDPGWTDVFSSTTNQEYVSAGEGAFGQSGQNRRGQTYQYAPKLGYTFVYNVKTKGRKSENLKITANPDGGFFFIPKTQSGAVEEVALFYRPTGSATYASVLGNSEITVTLSDTYMEVPANEMTSANQIYTKEYVGAKDSNGVAIPYSYASGVKLGKSQYGEMIIPHKLRLVYDNMAEYLPNKLVNGVTKKDANGRNVYVNNNEKVLGLYGTNSTKESIEINAKRANYQVGTLLKVDNTKESGAEIITGSVGHWWVGYRLPSTTIAITKANLNTILTELGLSSNVANSNSGNATLYKQKLDFLKNRANDIVIKAQQKGNILDDGYLGVKFTINTRTAIDDTSEGGVGNSNYLKYKGPEVTNVITGEHLGLIYYDEEKKEIYHTFTGNTDPNTGKVTSFTIGGPTGTNTTLTSANLPNKVEVKKGTIAGKQMLVEKVTLPNGLKKDIPAGTTALFEIKYDASVDRIIGAND